MAVFAHHQSVAALMLCLIWNLSWLMGTPVVFFLLSCPPLFAERRLRRQLSAVINFCRFHEERKVMYQDLVSKKEGVVASTRVAQVTVKCCVVRDCEGLRDRVYRDRGVTTLCRQRHGQYPGVYVVLACARRRVATGRWDSLCAWCVWYALQAGCSSCLFMLIRALTPPFSCRTHYTTTVPVVLQYVTPWFPLSSFVAIFWRCCAEFYGFVDRIFNA